MTAEQVLKSFKKGEPDQCWEWQRGRHNAGYGTVWYENRMWKAHRLTWALLKGQIPEGLHVLHRCDNPPCCNPNHLFLGTNDDNVADMISKGRNSPPPRNKGKVKRPLTSEEIKLLGTMPDYKLAKQLGSNKKYIGTVRKNHGIKSYAEQTGNNGQFGKEYIKGSTPPWFREGVTSNHL